MRQHFSSGAALLRGACLLALCCLLSGCGITLMSPSGDIALQQRNLIIAATALMLLVIVPVIAMCFVFAWRYRATNEDAAYDPDWHYSAQLEVGIWAIPLLIVIAIGAMAWIATHTLDPYRPLGRLGPGRPVPADAKPLEVQVVALDWKWLFIYPEYGVASVNEMAAPVDRPISFRITSASVWNTLSIPAVAGMIYAMPGMETKLQAVANREGQFMGLSGHYSGPGFSRMTFAFKSLPQAGFDEWVQAAKAEQAPLDRKAYQELEAPSEAVPVRRYGSVENGLYDAILGLCVAPGRMCVSEMHHIDMMGGGGENSEANAKRMSYDDRRIETGQEAPGATAPATGRPARSEEQPEGMAPREGNPSDNSGTNPPADGETGPAPAQLNTPSPPAGTAPVHQH